MRAEEAEQAKERAEEEGQAKERAQHCWDASRRKKKDLSVDTTVDPEDDVRCERRSVSLIPTSIMLTPGFRFKVIWGDRLDARGGTTLEHFGPS